MVCKPNITGEEKREREKKQAVKLTYGHEESDGEYQNDGHKVSVVAQMMGNEDNITVVTDRRCCCGSMQQATVESAIPQFPSTREKT